MNLEQVPAVDSHCHPFTEERRQLTPDQWLNILALKILGGSSEHTRWSMLTNLMVRDLSALLGCEDEFDAVVAARNTAVEDYPAYVARLFHSANITTLVLDCGWPMTHEVPLAACADLLPESVRPVELYRTERAFRNYYEYLRTLRYVFEVETLNPSFDVFAEEFRASLHRAADAGAVGYKTTRAYAVGLEIEPISYQEAKAVFQPRIEEFTGYKKIFDFLFMLTLEIAAERGLPVQVHTGHTSTVIPWPRVNPINMIWALNDPRAQGATIVLVHAGYPFLAETGYLCSIYPNVFCDFSLMVPWASIGLARRLEELLEAAPLSKIMWGSDGIEIPEINWLAARLGREALGEVLTRLVTHRILTAERAERAAALVLGETAQAVYGLG